MRRTSRKRTKRLAAVARAVLQSWWIAFTLFPFGWFGWAAFLYAGMRANRRRWKAYAGMYFVAAAISITFIAMGPDGPGDPDTWHDTVGGGIGLALWAAALVHSLVIRRPYLELVHVRDDPQLDAAEARLRRREGALELAQDDPEHALELGIGRPDLPGAYDGDVIDVNNAPAEVIAHLPGFTTDLAQRAVELREQIGGFKSVYDLADFFDFSPSVFERLKDRAVFPPR